MNILQHLGNSKRSLGTQNLHFMRQAGQMFAVPVGNVEDL